MKTILTRDITDRMGKTLQWITLEITLPFIPYVNTIIYYKDYEYKIKTIQINLDEKEIDLYIGSEWIENNMELERILKEDYLSIGWKRDKESNHDQA